MMYDLKLKENEEIKLIDDYVLVKNNSEYLTVIITNQRLLVLDYPSMLYNSKEDLRISGKLNYIKMKEVVLGKKISEIKEIDDSQEYVKITFVNDTYIEIKGTSVIDMLKQMIN